MHKPLALALVLVLAAPAAAVRQHSDQRRVYVGDDVRVLLDAGRSNDAGEVVRYFAVVERDTGGAGDFLGTVGRTLGKGYRRTDRDGVTRYEDVGTRRGLVRAKFEGDTLVRFTLRLRVPEVFSGRAGLEDVTGVEVRGL